MAALTPEAVVRDNARLLSVPEIVSRLNQMVEDPNASAADIANLISQDPTLTARLLKLVNSPFYNFPASIDTVSMAIAVLGTRQLRDLVMSHVLIRQFSKPTTTDFDIESFWCHSLTCAIGARIIAGELKVANQERFFVAGLLHDIGKMVMHLALPERCRELTQTLKQDRSHLQTIEERVFGFDHAQLGAELLRQWHLPESLIEPCRFHHHPEQATRFVRETAALHLADTIANNLQAPIAVEDDLLLYSGVWDLLGLDEKNLERFHELVYAQMDEVLQVFYYDQAA
jgi:putative nucleotidyltransferase with HDIG domain